MKYWTAKCIIPFWFFAAFALLLGILHAFKRPEQPILFHIVFTSFLVLFAGLGAIVLPILWKRGNREIEEEWKMREEEDRREQEAEKKEIKQPISL